MKELDRPSSGVTIVEEPQEDAGGNADLIPEKRFSLTMAIKATDPDDGKEISDGPSAVTEAEAREEGDVSSACETAPSPPPPPPPPNGGYGWVCTVCVALLNGHTWGVNSSYGVFLAHYLKNDVFPGATALQYAFVGSLSVSAAMMAAPLVTIAVRQLGTRPPMLLGTVLVSASFICASFATQIWHLFLSQGVLFGVGMGFIFIPSVGIVAQWFTTRRSLATGISVAGSGVGGIVYSIVAGAVMERSGLAWAFRILGIICFAVNLTCTLLIRDRNAIIGVRHHVFDVSLLRRPEYLLLVCFAWFSILSYFVLNFSLANYANAIGLPASRASLISAFFNVGQCVGRPVVGYFSDRTGRINMTSSATLLAAVFSLAIWINAKSYGLLIFFAVVCGTVGGTFWTSVAPVTAEVVGLRDTPSALSIMWIMIILPCLFSEPIALQIISGTGSYLGTQLWTGTIFVAAAAAMFVLRGWKIAQLTELAKASDETGENVDRYGAEGDEELALWSRQAGRKRMLIDCWSTGRV